MVSFRRDRQTLYVAGEIDMSTSEALRERVDEALRAGTVTLDMTGVEFMDSMGINALLQASAELKGEGPIRIVASRQVARIFEITGLDTHPEIELERAGRPPSRVSS